MKDLEAFSIDYETYNYGVIFCIESPAIGHKSDRTVTVQQMIKDWEVVLKFEHWLNGAPFESYYFTPTNEDKEHFMRLYQ